MSFTGGCTRNLAVLSARSCPKPTQTLDIAQIALTVAKASASQVGDASFLQAHLNGLQEGCHLTIPHPEDLNHSRLEEFARLGYLELIPVLVVL